MHDTKAFQKQNVDLEKNHVAGTPWVNKYLNAAAMAALHLSNCIFPSLFCDVILN